MIEACCVHTHAATLSLVVSLRGPVAPLVLTLRET